MSDVAYELMAAATGFRIINQKQLFFMKHLTAYNLQKGSESTVVIKEEANDCLDFHSLSGSTKMLFLYQSKFISMAIILFYFILFFTKNEETLNAAAYTTLYT